MYKYWDIKKQTEYNDKTISIELVNKNNDMSIGIKWDGCGNLTKFYNGYSPNDEYTEEVGENSDYIHICEMKEFIEHLQEIVKIAEDNFTREDYEQGWA